MFESTNRFLLMDLIRERNVLFRYRRNVQSLGKVLCTQFSFHFVLDVNEQPALNRLQWKPFSNVSLLRPSVPLLETSQLLPLYLLHVLVSCARASLISVIVALSQMHIAIFHSSADPLDPRAFCRGFHSPLTKKLQFFHFLIIHSPIHRQNCLTAAAPDLHLPTDWINTVHTIWPIAWLMISCESRSQDNSHWSQLSRRRKQSRAGEPSSKVC